MDKEVIVAIIGLSGLIIAAIITGIFTLIKRDKSKENLQTAQTGGHAFQASGNASQHINITEVIKPEESPDRLLVTIAEISDYVNEILVENQQILTPLFAKEPNLKEIETRMGQLFNIQHGRGKFGDWVAFLEHEKEIEKEPTIRDEIKKLLSLIRGLHESLYSYIDPKKLDEKYFDKKHFMLAFFDKDGVHLSEIRTVATNYLVHLRNSVEKIGYINGKLRSIKSKRA